MKSALLKRIASLLLTVIVLIFVAAGCDPSGIDPIVDPGNSGVVKPTGTLEVEFRVPGSFLPPNRVLRADLSLAIDAENLYKGNLSHVENVYNSKLIYQFKLEPGNYYYKAGIICIAEGDSCSAAGFPGGKFGMKWAIGNFTIKNRRVTGMPNISNIQ